MNWIVEVPRTRQLIAYDAKSAIEYSVQKESHKKLIACRGQSQH